MVITGAIWTLDAAVLKKGSVSGGSCEGSCNSHNVKTTSQKGSFESSHGETRTNPGGNQPPGQQGGDSLR